MNAWPKGMKRTKSRVAIYKILEAASQPLSPKEIHAKINQGDFWLSTVYRVLGQFEQEKMILRIAGMDVNHTLFELNRHEHKHFAVCVGCHQRFELDDCPIHEDVHVQAEGFEITEHRVEVFGYCAECLERMRLSKVKHDA